MNKFIWFRLLPDACKFSDHFALLSKMIYSSQQELSTPDGTECNINPPDLEVSTACPNKDKLQNTRYVPG